jgi:hypothetical protein
VEDPVTPQTPQLQENLKKIFEQQRTGFVAQHLTPPVSNQSFAFQSYSSDNAFITQPLQPNTFGQFQSPSKESKTLPYHLVISFARNKLNQEQEERQIKEVDEMMELEGSSGRSKKVKKK